MLLLPGQARVGPEVAVADCVLEVELTDVLVTKVVLATEDEGVLMTELELVELALLVLLVLLADDEETDAGLLLLVSDALLVLELEVDAGGGTKMGEDSAKGELLVSTLNGAPKYSSSTFRVLICDDASALPSP